MTGSDFKRGFNHSIYPRGSKRTTNKGFVSIENGQIGGTHWICFYMKDEKSFYFDPFGGQPDTVLLNQLSKT